MVIFWVPVLKEKRIATHHIYNPIEFLLQKEILSNETNQTGNTRLFPLSLKFLFHSYLSGKKNHKAETII